MKKFLLVFAPLALLFIFQNCKTGKIENANSNPPALGFDSENSDAKAIALADEVMLANGGRKTWDETRFIKWNFFASRTLLWDKHKSRVRIEFLKKPMKIIVNLNDGTGKVQIDGVEQTQPDTLKKYLKMGKEVWINDSYWLVMPFKLKDTGVTLKYFGDSKTEENQPADLLQLTFKSVGVTPDNKYVVWVDKTTRRVSQWAYFEKFLDTTPGFINPWTDYQNFNGLWLSGGRGKRTNGVERKLTEIEVPKTVDENLFKKF